MSELQVAKEVFLSIFKWVLWFIIVNNLIWALLFLGTVMTDRLRTRKVYKGRYITTGTPHVTLTNVPCDKRLLLPLFLQLQQVGVNNDK